MGHAYAVAGRKSDALNTLSQLKNIAGTGETGNAAEAMVWAGMGNVEQEVAALQRAGQANDPQMIWVGVDPRWDSVRSHPAVQPLLAELRPRRP